MVDYSVNRRHVLAATGTALTVGLAGCSGGDDGDGSNGSSDLDVPSEVQTWLDDEDANNADSVEDLTGQSEVTIVNGEGGNFQFAPAVARISTGTTVTWEWDSAGHSCTSQQTPSGESFDSGIQGEGSTFEQTFDTAGNVLYFCNPHRANGHVAALIVEE